MPANFTRISFLIGVAALVFSGEPTTAQERPAEEPLVVQLTIHPYGFIPSEITVPEGLINLEVVSRVGFPEIPILLERDAEQYSEKQTLRSENHDARRRKWDQSMVLSPGNYTISIPDKPRWTAKVIVTARSK